MNTDKRRRNDGRKGRVVHVPMTDAEFQAFRSYAFQHGKGMGDLTAAALRNRYRVVFAPLEVRP